MGRGAEAAVGRGQGEQGGQDDGGASRQGLLGSGADRVCAEKGRRRGAAAAGGHADDGGGHGGGREVEEGSIDTGRGGWQPRGAVVVER